MSNTNEAQKINNRSELFAVGFQKVSKKIHHFFTLVARRSCRSQRRTPYQVLYSLYASQTHSLQYSLPADILQLLFMEIAAQTNIKTAFKTLGFICKSWYATITQSPLWASMYQKFPKTGADTPTNYFAYLKTGTNK
jgi:hypothetical protein